MKISVNKDNLYPVIARVYRAVSARPTDPAMAGIKIEIQIDENQKAIAKASAFDGENAITGFFPVTLTGEAEVMRPSGLAFFDILRDLPDGEITLELSNNQILITAGRGKFKIPQLGVSPLDASSIKKPALTGVVSGEEFANAVAKVINATSKNTTQLALASVRVEANENTLRLVATDRYRMAKIDIPWVRNFTEDKVLLLPFKVIGDLAKAYGKTNKLTLGFGDTLGMAEGDSVESIFRVAAGEFPKYEALLNPTITATADFDADEFRGALKRVSKFNNEFVKVTVSTDAIRIENSTSENGEGSEEISVKYEGSETFTTSFNPQYLLDAMGQLEGVTKLNYVGQAKPTTFVSASLPNYIHLVMPVNR